jgi:hypothetical protein
MAGLATAQWYNIWIVADHAAVTFDLYLSKAAGPAGEATLPAPGDLVERGVPFAVATTDPLNGMIFANPRGTGQAARIHVDEIWWDGDQGLSKPTMARNPNPADQQQDVPRDVILSWIPAPSAVMHNIYFGTGPDSIALVADGQETNTFDPGGPLEFNRTYYWRIDEVNTAPDFTVFEGSLWSFTVEPVSYPIPNVTATASSASENMGPERTVDGSGLQGDQHSTEPPRMWLSANGGPQPTWIQYSFGTAHKLDQLLVWNSNQLLEPILGFGAKAVTVEHSLDGAAWTTLGDFEFARAAGREAYTANTAVDFSGAVAKHVRLTIHSNWGGVLPQYGLSEVRFFYLPVLPRQPLPAAGQTTVAVDAMLSWRAGREAASHQVQLSTDQQAVIDGAAPMQTVVENSFDPGPLDLGSTYFWKVTEVNDAETPAAWEGEVWSFTTREYLAIEDFESYNDDDNRIYDTWIDGLTTGASGSQVGYDVSPFAERLTVHSGKQSMPLHYDNTASPFFSETERTFASPQNWTTNAADTFTLYVRGRSEGNTPDLLYVTVQDSGNRTATAIHPDPLIVTTGQWTPWSIPLSVFTSEGVRADNIKKLIIGVGDRTQSTPGGAGLLYIDSVSFGRPASQ